MKKILKTISVILFVAAVFFAAGCAEKAAAPGDETVTPGNEITEKDQVVTKNDSGETISLKNGENFTLILRENPSTGYAWELNLSKGLSVLSDEYIQDPTPEDTTGEHMTGVPGNHSWVIQAEAPGIQQVNSIYKRGSITGTEENYTLTVEVV